MNNIIRFIGHYGSRLPLVKLLKPIVLKFVNPWDDKQQKEKFLKNGLAVLSQFDSALSTNGIQYSLVFGTLLGAIREKGFIKHDFDIDVAIWNTEDYKKVEKSLLENGFKLKRRSETDNGDFGREDTYVKDSVLIDIFYFYPYDNKLAYTTVLIPFEGTETIEESIKIRGGAMPIQLILPFSHKIERIPFYNLYLPVISNSIEFLEARYGKNWRIPDPTFVYPKMGDARCNYRKDKITKILVWNRYN